MDFLRCFSGFQRVFCVFFSQVLFVSGLCASEAFDYDRVLHFAEGGSAAAQTALGFHYISGQGGTRSVEMAYHWYSKAAAQHHPGALFSLASLYYNGDGVEQSNERAAELYRRASELGHARAMDNLGIFYREGIVFEQSDEKALSWFVKAYEAGLASAATNAGWMYANGRGVTKSFPLAARWYRKAMREGDLVAVYNLGLFYALGQGVETDFAQAMRYLVKASAGGHRSAAIDVVTLSSQFPRMKISETTALREAPTYSAAAAKKIEQGTEVFVLTELDEGWLEVVALEDYQIGFLSRPKPGKVD